MILLGTACALSQAGTYAITDAFLNVVTPAGTHASKPVAGNNFTGEYGVNWYDDVSSKLMGPGSYMVVLTTPSGMTTGAPSIGGGTTAVAPSYTWVVQWTAGLGESQPPNNFDTTIECKGYAFSEVKIAVPFNLPGVYIGSSNVSAADIAPTSSVTASGSGTFTSGSTNYARYQDIIVSSTDVSWTQISPGVWQTSVPYIGDANVNLAYQNQPGAYSFAVPYVDVSGQTDIELRPISISGQTVEPNI